MSLNKNNHFLTRGVFATVLFAFMASGAASAQEPPRALCYLDSFEAEMEEDSAMKHAVEMEVICAHADRSVLGVADTNLQLLDGETDLIQAGVEWMKAYEERGGTGYFSSQGSNTIEVAQVGRERYIELRAHSHALPETGVATLEGTVDLVIEADCIGDDAVETVKVETTAGALRSGAAITLADGGEIMASEQGQTGDLPMLGIGGDGSYVGLVEPPDGVSEMVFFGKKRVVVEAEAGDETAVTLEVCPTSVSRVPVSIEASI